MDQVKARRIAAELFQAMPAAEIISPAVVLDRAGGRRGTTSMPQTGSLTVACAVFVVSLREDWESWQFWVGSTGSSYLCA